MGNPFISGFGDVFYLFKNLISSQETYITLGLSAPIIAGAAIFDDQIHACFYNKKLHKNIYHVDPIIDFLAEWGLVMPYAAIALGGILTHNLDFKYSARVFIFSYPFIWACRGIFKQAKWDWNLRPKCEFFDKNKKFYGGCPSGHFIEIAYAITLFGLRFGPAAAIPFALYGIFEAANFMMVGRHFVSQMLAGAALGVCFGFAAEKVVESHLEKLNENLLSFEINHDKLGIILKF